MRLWHYRLIPVLPNQMLVSQWRECIAIKRQWEKGTLKHRLVSYVMDYDKVMFLAYIYRVIREMQNRDIKYKKELFNELYDFCSDKEVTEFILDKSNYPEHNDRYFKQCYFNLQEKYDRGIISEEEWKTILKDDICLIISLDEEE
jgi:uncharacterized protein (TIGR02328 family)